MKGKEFPTKTASAKALQGNLCGWSLRNGKKTRRWEVMSEGQKRKKGECGGWIYVDTEGLKVRFHSFSKTCVWHVPTESPNILKRALQLRGKLGSMEICKGPAEIVQGKVIMMWAWVVPRSKQRSSTESTMGQSGLLGRLQSQHTCRTSQHLLKEQP